MWKKLVAVFLFQLCFTIALAADIRLEWDANPEVPCTNATVEDICLDYYSGHNTFTPGEYNWPYPYDTPDIPAGIEECIITVDDADEYDLFFVLTATSRVLDEATGEYVPYPNDTSGFSNEVSLSDEPDETPATPMGGGSSGGGCFITTIIGG